MWAASRGDREVVQLLMKAGADVNFKNQGGYTALMLAEFNGYSGVVRILKAAGAQE